MALQGTIPAGGVSPWVAIGQLGHGPLTIILNSSAGGRQIACSLMGLGANGADPVDGVAVAPDRTTASQIAVVTNSTVGAVQFTGAVGDVWKVA